MYFSQLQQAEDAREAELEDVTKVTAEFTQRLADAEKKINQVIRVSYLRKIFMKSNLNPVFY